MPAKESVFSRRLGIRWPPNGLLEVDRQEYDPPDAPGIYPWALLFLGPAWDIVHGKSHPLWLAIGGLIVLTTAWLRTVHLAFLDRVRGENNRRQTVITLAVVMAFALGTYAVFGGAWAVVPAAAGIAIGVTVRGGGIVTVGAPLLSPPPSSRSRRTPGSAACCRWPGAPSPARRSPGSSCGCSL